MIKNQKGLLGNEEIEDFVHSNYKTTNFEGIKGPYRKVNPIFNLDFEEILRHHLQAVQ